MEDELFKQVYHQIKQTAKNKILKRATFSHAQILRMYFRYLTQDFMRKLYIS
jgi:hypothetical protein